MAILIDDKTQTLLQKVPYFKDLDQAALASLAQEVVIRHYRAGEIIFIEDDPGAGLHLVAEGLCKVYRLSEEGREQILATLAPGDSCNEVPVVDGGPNPANLAAVDDATVWIISGESWRLFPQ